MNESGKNLAEAIRHLSPDAGSSLGYGWNVMTAWFLELLLVVVVLVSAMIPLGAANGAEEYYAPGLFLAKLFSMAYWLFVVAPISYGASWVFLKAVRNHNFDIREMFDTFSNYLNVILAKLLATAIIATGFFLLIVPGIIFACKLAFVPFLVMDRRMEPVDAVRESWNMTRNGVAWQVFFLAIISFFIFIAGMILLIVGTIPAMIWIRAAFASLYESVNRQRLAAEPQAAPQHVHE
ncbi:MAG: hypothetical protein JW861_03580 [Bacteroidales bacterium]|nr:hypothetical protein [Bacteroidales bacterium]